jgi:hypothetical protein
MIFPLISLLSIVDFVSAGGSQPTCPSEQRLVNGVCECFGKQRLVNGVCEEPCIGYQKVERIHEFPGWSCVDPTCIGDQTLKYGVCKDPICIGDQTLEYGFCKDPTCPSEQRLVNGVCECFGKQRLVNGVCEEPVCNGDQTLDWYHWNCVDSGCIGDQKVERIHEFPGWSCVDPTCIEDKKLVDGVCIKVSSGNYNYINPLLIVIVLIL